MDANRTNLGRTRRGLLAALLLLAGLAGPGCDASEEDDRCVSFGTCEVQEKLQLTLIDGDVRPPANVSLLFKVDGPERRPVADLTPSNFEVYENESLVSRFESQQQILPKRGRFRYSIALVLDLSGSIVASENLGALKQAARSFVDALMPLPDDPRYGEIEMGLWWFDGSTDIDSLVGFRFDPATLASSIDRIDAGLTVDNSTNLYGAVVQGVDRVQRQLQSVGRQQVITAGSVVLFTDGTDQANRVSRSAALQAVRNAPATVTVYTIGLGGEVDVPTLRDIGTGGFVSAGNLTELVPRFRELADLVRDEANSYYLLEYCSPKRAGDNDLTVKVTLGESAGLLATRFSAKDFSAGCTVSAPAFRLLPATEAPASEPVARR